MSRFISASDSTTPRSKEWLAAQSALEAKITAEKLAAQQRNSQGGEKSLYETLQANKAAKEEAFQEANKFKNQFRPLDDDEADFLSDIVQQQRDAERAARREADAKIEDFKARQASSTNDGTAAGPGGQQGGGEEWSAASRKRRREQGRISGVKVRRMSSGQGGRDVEKGVEKDIEKDVTGKEKSVAGEQGNESELKVKTTDTEVSRKESPPTEMTTIPPKPTLGLADYSSDDD